MEPELARVDPKSSQMVTFAIRLQFDSCHPTVGYVLISKHAVFNIFFGIVPQPGAPHSIAGESTAVDPADQHRGQ